MSKEALILGLTELLENEDVEAIQDKVAELKEHYEALLSPSQEATPTQEAANGEEQQEEKSEEPAASEQAEEPADAPDAKDAPSEEGSDEETSDEGSALEETEEGPVAIESAELQDEHDKQFKLLLDEFNKRRNELKKKRAEEVKENVEKAKAVIEELKKVNEEEENISRSFNKLNDLRETWKSIGNVPKDQYRDLQHEYSQQLDIFFYNINIYKELRENDLKKNSGLKQALISDVLALEKEENIKVLDQKLREFQEQWHQIGPTFKEEWEELRDKFWDGIRAGYARIHEHFQKRREEHEANLKAKQELVELIKAETAKEFGDHKAWKKSTELVIEAQGNWRKIGFATKKDNDRIWKEFRGACDEYFEKKRAYYEQFKEAQETVKGAKNELIQQAEALKDSTDWRDTTEKLKRLQQQWKAAGSSHHRDEQSLWKKFRGACDHFFEAKKNHFAKQDEQNAANLKLKNDLLAKIEAHKPSGKKQEDLAAIKGFQDEWKSIGNVPIKAKDKVNGQYFKLIDGLFNALDMDQAEKAKARFQSKLDSMGSGPNAERSLQKEQNFLRGKKQQLQEEVTKLESNIAMFFKHPDPKNPTYQEMNKKVDRIKQDIDKLVEQEKMLRQHAKQAQ